MGFPTIISRILAATLGGVLVLGALGRPAAVSAQGPAPASAHQPRAILALGPETISPREIQINGEDWPDDHRRSFLSAIAPSAIATAHRDGIPASITLAQAVLESGWGRSNLARTHHNLFGIKAPKGEETVDLSTVEYRHGHATRTRAHFRAYPSWEESIASHGRLLSQDARYAKARAQADNWHDFLDAMAPVYATDPAYAAHITQIIETYGLDRWDDMASARLQPA